MRTRKRKTSSEAPWVVKGVGRMTDAEFAQFVARLIADLYRAFPALSPEQQRQSLGALDKFAACIGEWPKYKKLRSKFVKSMTAE